MKKTELHPQIFLIENFLSDQECDHYIEMTKDKVFEEAKINMRGRQVMSKGIRNNENYKVSGFNEMFRIYKYSPGQQFKMHHDGSYIKNENEKSFYTFLIYLNNDFEGGETEFEHLFTVAPKKGSALVFYHPLRHEGKTLISGQKYVLRTDVMYLKT